MGESRRLWIEGTGGRLEATLRMSVPAHAGVVLAHPHPLHGGTLHNPVVFHADRELNRAGFTAMRLNFRGVGASDGVHDGGAGETDDLAATSRWLRGVAPGLPLLLVGYSFGSWCAVRLAARDPGVAGVVAIGLPPRALPLEALSSLRQPLAVVQGERDEFGSPREIRDLLRPCRAEHRIWVVEQASHLFPGVAGKVARLVVEAAEWVLGRS